jgi:hypothetical protein
MPLAFNSRPYGSGTIGVITPEATWNSLVLNLKSKTVLSLYSGLLSSILILLPQTPFGFNSRK